MKYNNQIIPSINKVHYNVKEMMEEAQNIIRPECALPSITKQNRSRDSILYPINKPNESRKDMLHMQRQSYKRIKRGKRQLNDRINKTIEIVKDYHENDKQLNIRELIYKRNKNDRLQNSIVRCEQELLLNDHVELKKKHHRYMIKKSTINILPFIRDSPKEKKNRTIAHIEINKNDEGRSIFAKYEHDDPSGSEGNQGQVNRQKKHVKMIRKRYENYKSIELKELGRIEKEERYEPWQINSDDCQITY